MNDKFVISYFIDRFFVIGKYLPITLIIAIISMVFGLIIGTTVALLKKKGVKGLNGILNLYISYFRGTPLIVQLFIFFFGLPQIFPGLVSIGTFALSIIVLSLNSGAYMAEVVRSSINSVDKGQMEGALSVGMSKSQAMVRIILPQAARIAIPPLGNTFISITQGTAITFTVGIKEMMAIAKMGSAASYRFLENFLAVGFIYWIVTLVFTYLLSILENKLSKGY